MALNEPNPRSTARIAGRPIHALLVSIPVVCFVGAFFTDLAYWKTAAMQWANMSVWMLTIGLIVAIPVVLAGMIDFFGDRRIRALPSAWIHGLGNGIAIVLCILNAFIHSRDAYTSVVPSGVILSGLVVLILAVTGWLGSGLVYRHGVGVRSEDALVSRRLALCAAAIAAAGLAACGPNPVDPKRQIGANPYLPDIHQYLLPPMHVAKIVGWGDAKPTVAPGLKVEAIATGLKGPRSVYVLPNGDILVVETGGPKAPINRPKEFVMAWVEKQAHSPTKPGNRILLFRDAGPGTPMTRTVFIDHLNSPFGVVLVGGDLYVANTDAVVRYPYQTGQMQITDPGVKLTDLPGGPIDHHWTKSLTASPDGTKLYAGVGSNSNITENGLPAELDRASVWEIDRATGAHRLYATGLRNPNGLQFEPTTHVLWAVVNERDELGPDLVPDYLTSVKDGAFYGWPYSYYGQHVDPRVKPQRPDLVAKAIPPDYALSSHVAPLGMVFNTGASLPAQYSGGAFVGEHGSWDRSVLNGYKVVYVPFANGRPNGMAQDVVTGFLTSDDKARGRPVGLAMDAKGGLLIADDVGNTVWRVTGTGANP